MHVLIAGTFDMLTLLQFTAHPGKMDLSPFTGKVECFLKYHKLPYQVKKGNVWKAPKKKLPVLIDGETSIGDSELILKYLSEKYQLDTDSYLSLDKKCYVHAIKKMVEEHLYFTVIYLRWQAKEGWAQTKRLFFGKSSFLMRTFTAPLVRRSMMRNLWGHGIGRHSPEEVTAFGKEDLAVLDQLIGETGYVMGNQFSSADITVFPFLSALLHTPIETPLLEEVRNRPNLLNYTQRLFEEIWK